MITIDALIVDLNNLNLSLNFLTMNSALQKVKYGQHMSLRKWKVIFCLIPFIYYYVTKLTL